jgi:hypothetical protein
MVLMMVCFTGPAKSEIGPAGFQYADKTVAGEPYAPEQIPKRLAQINKNCATRLLNSQYDKEFVYISSLASRAPLSREIIVELVDMVDIVDSVDLLIWNIPNKEQLGARSSPAAMLLVYTCADQKKIIEELMPLYQSMPQHRILKQVLEQIDLNEKCRIRDEEKQKRPKPKKPVAVSQGVPSQEALPVGVVTSKNTIYIGSGVMTILIAAWFAWRKRSKS